MGERKNGLVLAMMLGMAAGKTPDQIVDEILNPMCFKCGKFCPPQDLISISAGRICAPCILEGSVTRDVEAE